MYSQFMMHGQKKIKENLMLMLLTELLEQNIKK